MEGEPVFFKKKAPTKNLLSHKGGHGMREIFIVSENL